MAKMRSPAAAPPPGRLPSRAPIRSLGVQSDDATRRRRGEAHQAQMQASRDFMEAERRSTSGAPIRLGGTTRGSGWLADHLATSR